MKKVLLPSIAALFFCLTIHAQTTEQEYNYITKGYLDDIRMGKNILEGYRLLQAQAESKVTGSKGEWWSATIYYFKKGASSKAFLVDCTDKDGNRRAFCIPTSNAPQELWKRTFSEFQSSGQTWSLVFVWSLSQLVSHQL